jgi:hypothetical protein
MKWPEVEKSTKNRFLDSALRSLPLSRVEGLEMTQTIAFVMYTWCYLLLPTFFLASFARIGDNTAQRNTPGKTETNHLEPYMGRRGMARSK